MTVVTADPVVKGIAHALQLDWSPVEGATGDTDTQVAAKMARAVGLANRGKRVLLHLDGADQAGHRKDAREKMRFLKRLDRELFHPLMGSGHTVLICGDHGTSPIDGRHLADPQPFVLYGSPHKGALGALPGAAACSLLASSPISTSVTLDPIAPRCPGWGVT